MTPDDLRALREVAGCGKATCPSHQNTPSAVDNAGYCDDCATLYLNAALAQRVEGLQGLIPYLRDVLELHEEVSPEPPTTRDTIRYIPITANEVRALLAALTGGAK